MVCSPCAPFQRESLECPLIQRSDKVEETPTRDVIEATHRENVGVRCQQTLMNLLAPALSGRLPAPS